MPGSVSRRYVIAASQPSDLRRDDYKSSLRWLLVAPRDTLRYLQSLLTDRCGRWCTTAVLCHMMVFFGWRNQRHGVVEKNKGYEESDGCCVFPWWSIECCSLSECCLTHAVYWKHRFDYIMSGML